MIRPGPGRVSFGFVWIEIVNHRAEFGRFWKEARLLVSPPKMPARYFSARRDFSRRTEIFLDAPRKTRRARKNSARRENSTRRENLGAPRSKIAACTFLARRIELAATKTIATSRRYYIVAASSIRQFF